MTTTEDRAFRTWLRPGGAVTAALVAAVLLTSLLAPLLTGVPARADTPAYAFGVVTKTNPPASMRPGQPYPITVVLRNDGTETWLSEEGAGGFHPVRLGTIDPDDRRSPFAVQDAAWLWSKGRRIRMVTPAVPPGRYGVFVFTFTAPPVPGVYPEERFRPLAEGVEWMTGPAITFPAITVPNPGAAPAIPAADVVPEPCLPSLPHHEGPRAPAYQDAGPPAIAQGHGPGSPRGPALAHPSAVAVAPNGDVFVADSANDRIVKMRPDGTVLKTFGAGQMLAPGGVAVTANGFVYIADTGNDRIQVWDSFGIAKVAQFGGAGSAPGQFDAPRGLSIVPDGSLAGSLAVADSGNDRIQIVSSAGAPMAVIGASGSDPGRLLTPHAVSVHRGHVFVADTGNNRVQRFTIAGDPAGFWGGSRMQDGCLSAPRGIVATTYGVFVADSGNERITHYSRTGALLDSWSGAAAGIAVEAGGVLWAAGATGVWRSAPQAQAAPPLP